MAVHGLNALNKELHAEATWTVDGKLWLRDFLPHLLPNVRVLLFAYNSNVAFETSTVGIREAADSLLNWLILYRIDRAKRPLVFIAHSLGGLVVKRALVTAKLDPMYSSIDSATGGIAFLGTPHRGGNGAAIGQIAANVARIMWGGPANSFMKALQKDSSAADDLAEDFRRLLPNLRILSFYETLPQTPLGLIVDKKSATLGVDSTKETQVAVAANHRGMCKFGASTDHTYQLVSRNIQLLVQSVLTVKDTNPAQSDAPVAMSTIKPSIRVPHPKNWGFVGREEELDFLSKRLNNADVRHERIALYGLGGIGKSQIAIEFAYRFQDAFEDSDVLWIHASNRDRYRESLEQISQKLGIPGQNDPEVDKMRLVKNYLEQRNNRRWLMIIDNADDIDIFFEAEQKPNDGLGASQKSKRLATYIPESPEGMILLTTRDKQVAVKLTRTGDMREILPMSSDDSTKLVQSMLTDVRDSHDDVLSKLVQQLERLPLALAQAAAFIQEESISVQEYVAMFDSSAVSAGRLLNQDFEASGRDSDVVPNAIAKTWMLSFDNIQKRNSRAANMLSLMACYDRQAIPHELLLEDGESISSPGFNFRVASGVLKAFCLVFDNFETKTFEVHPLVHLVMQIRLDSQDSWALWASEAVGRVSIQFPNPTIENWKICALYLPHALSVIHHCRGVAESFTPEHFTLLRNVSRYLWDQARSQSFENLELQAVEMSEQVYGPSHSETLRMRHRRSITLRSQGKLSLAEKMESEVLTARRALGAEDEALVLSMTNLAKILEDQRKIPEAEELHKNAVKMALRVLHEQHETTIEAIYGLAWVYKLQHKYDRARELINKAMSQIYDRVSEHEVLRLDGLAILAAIFEAQNKPTKARQLYLLILERMQDTYGPENSHRLIIMADLARVLHEEGEFTKANELCTMVLNTRKALYGMEHPATLETMHRLALIHQSQVHGEKAQELMIECAKVSNMVLGQDHALTQERSAWIKRNGHVPDQLYERTTQNDIDLLDLLDEGVNEDLTSHTPPVTIETLLSGTSNELDTNLMGDSIILSGGRSVKSYGGGVGDSREIYGYYDSSTASGDDHVYHDPRRQRPGRVTSGVSKPAVVVLHGQRNDSDYYPRTRTQNSSRWK